MTMVLHKDRRVDLRNGATRFTTLCNRMNKRGSDGMNIADTDDQVTCKFCLAKMQGLPEAQSDDFVSDADNPENKTGFASFNDTMD